MRSNLRLLVLALALSCFSLVGSLSGQTIPIETNIPENVSISVEEESPDQKIAERLQAVFDQLEGLGQVDIQVTSGVVVLSGVASDSKSAQEALALAKSTDGVVYVSNRMMEDVEIANRLAPAKEKAQEMIGSTIRKAPVIGIALLVLVLAILLGRFFGSRQALLKRFGLRELSANLVSRLIRLVIIVGGVVLALEILDATALASAILGVAGVAGLALGFAFRNIVENYLAGVLLSMRNPFSTGDAVEIEGYTGKIMMLTSRDTVLMTPDGNHVRIPNSTMMTSALTNYSRNPMRRFEFAIGVSVELDLTQVRALGMETLERCPGVLSDPSPSIIIEALGDSTVNMRFFAWIDQTSNDFLKTKSEAIRLVKVAFDDAEVEMPEPIYRVMLRGSPTDVLAGGAPAPSATKLKRELGSATSHIEDTSADDTIDKQVHKELERESDENLLKDE